MRYAGRIACSAALVLLYFVANHFADSVSPLVSGPAAGLQFQNSDAAFLASQAVTHSFTGVSFSVLFLIAGLILVWVVPLIWRWLVMAPPAALLLAALAPHPALAYYDQSNYAEDYFILPNESAFYLPDVGANKDTQGSFGSEAYLRANKIAAKRFEIPHVKLQNSGFWSNYYVPAGRLIIVDRTPYSREWVASPTRGTSAKDEAFPCQSSEGLTVTVGVAIGASVTEDQSPAFLYHFGVNPPAGSRSDPKVVFTSVFYGKSLAQAMDTVVHSKVQTLVCAEISKRTLDQVNNQASQIESDAQNGVRTYMASVGITLDFMGWADTFTFDRPVQKAINDRYIAKTVGPYLPVLKELAGIRVEEGLGDGLRTHGLPSSLLAIPSDLLNRLGTALPAIGGPAAPAATAVPAAGPAHPVH